MKIGIDGQKLLIDKMAGPEVYTYNTIRGFAKIDNRNNYVIYFDKEPSHDFWQELSMGNPNFSYKTVPNLLSWTQMGLAIELLVRPVDVLFNAKHTVPVIHHPKTKMISMIHGLEFKVNRQFHKNPIKGIIHPVVLWWVLAFSHKIIVPSKATRDAIAEKKWLFFRQEKMEIIPEGVAEHFYKRPLNEIQDMRDKYKIGDGPYLLFVSTIQPRKNIPKMMHAFSNVVKNYQKHANLKIMIVGKLGWLYKESLAAPGKYGVADNTRFLGRVSDEDLAKLLSGARAFISCSLEEGFGIPLLEAMACETAAIVSNIPAFKELGMQNVTYVNPESVESIETGILSNLNSDQTESIRNAKNFSKNFTWEKGSEKIISVFNSVVKNS